jgi:hypothetical protein
MSGERQESDMQISASQASPSAATTPNAFPDVLPAARLGAMVAEGARAIHGAAASLARPATLRWAQAQALKLVTMVAGH